MRFAGVLVKLPAFPFPMVELNSPSRNPESGFNLGPWLVEPKKNKISRGTEEKRLENRLMQTLVFLASHPGEVISREKFFDSVWNGRVVNEEALSRAISLLRTALEDSAQRPEFIQTIPGSGYRLIADPKFVQQENKVTPASTDPGEAGSGNAEADTEVASGNGIAAHKGKPIPYMVTGLAVVLLVLFALDRFVLAPSRDAAVAISASERGLRQGAIDPLAENSVAVLPFVNMSSDPEQEFFADGMTEELLNMLASVPKLRVTARTSSFFFKGKDMPVAKIAETLNVKHILEGSVRRSGDSVRITAQLVEAVSDRHIWSQTYDRKLEDIFTIQDEVASAIAAALIDSFDELKIKPVSRSSSLAAFEAYRAGRLLWWRRSVPELHQAIELFEKAVEKDHEFAPAYAALADSTMLLVMYGDMHIAKGEAIAESMIDKALELDPKSAEAYAALGLSRLIVGRKEEAESALRLAIAYDGSYIPAYIWMSVLLGDLGRVPEAGSILLEAMSMDPLNEILAVNYAENLQARGDNDGARDTLASLLRMQPGHVGMLSALSDIERNAGNLEAAWNLARRAYDLAPENVVVAISMGRAWIELGEFEAAENLWLEAMERSPESVELQIQYLTMLLIQGRADEAEPMFQPLFGEVAALPIGFQRTYHYFMGLLCGVRRDALCLRDHFELVIDPLVDQLFDRDQIFVLTTTAMVNEQLGDTEAAEDQLSKAERVVGHARVDGINNADLYYSASSIFALRGDKQRALQNLQMAYDRGFRQKWKLEIDARMDSLRDETAFISIQQRIAQDIEQARLKVRELLAIR